MADAYTGEIRIFAGNYAPKDWAFCNGQLLSIQQNQVLFTILGNQYGGDGRTTFALPNLMGSACMNQGSGDGLTSRTFAEKVGEPSVTLLTSQIPNHSHNPQAIDGSGSANTPTQNVWAQNPPLDDFTPAQNMYDATANVEMSPIALNVTGGSQAHNNMQPFIAQNFIICLSGEYPMKS
ncbi:phage tail protein [Paenibacillus pini]|uniref:Microcystin dependent protein n=1 Tax=Paenibacillus pini JCM 16418 TaxID=1236976 RepID=W7YEQ0_9BACL|nr:tail fiber protein [Paenibacillus pini]GAF09420.1 microcystin dependent protein [Paenibacillus pini JCM 16418]